MVVSLCIHTFTHTRTHAHTDTRAHTYIRVNPSNPASRLLGAGSAVDIGLAWVNPCVYMCQRYHKRCEEKHSDTTAHNPVVSVGVCYTAVDAVSGGLTTGWWAVVLECFSSHLLCARVCVRVCVCAFLYVCVRVWACMCMYT